MGACQLTASVECARHLALEVAEVLLVLAVPAPALREAAVLPRVRGALVPARDRTLEARAAKQTASNVTTV